MYRGKLECVIANTICLFNKLIFDGRHRLKMRCLLMSLQTVFIFPYFQQKELVIVVNRKKIMITDIAFFLSAGFRNSGSV